MAAAAVPTVQEMALAVPLKFFGVPTPKDTLTPRAFLRELESRQIKHGWNDKAIMPYLESCLDKEAGDWFNARVKTQTHKHDDEDEAPANNFEAFKKMFKQHYLLGGKTYRPNWSMILHQQKDEATSSYLSRSFNSLHMFIEANAEHLAPTVPKPNMATIIAAAFPRTALDGITAENQRTKHRDMVVAITAAVQDASDNNARIIVREHRATLYDFLGQAMLFDGLRNTEQRTLAHRLLDEEKPINDVIDLVHSLALRSTNKANVHGIDLTPDDTPDAHVDAAGQQAGGRGRGRGGRAGRGRGGGQRAATNGGPCTFCNAKDHATKDCKQRSTCLRFGPQIVAEMKKKAGVSATTGTPALMDVPTAPQAHPWSPASGNASGWQ